MTEENGTQDPLDSAMDAKYTPRTSTYFGQVGVDVYYAVLQTGIGKVEFDPAQHLPDRRVTAIKIAVDAYKRDGTTFVLERELIAESKEWAQIVKPSLRALNADLRGLNGKYVQVQTVPTGRTYKNKSGEEKQSTILKFLAVYQTPEECEQAASVFYSSLGNGQTPAATTTPTASVSNTERATAQKFLAPLWKSANGNLQRFEELLAKTSPVNKFFKIDSKEVLDVIGVPS